MSKLEDVIKLHEQLCGEARDIISKKGADYNRSQQLNGDTLFNLKVAKLLGVIDNATQGILVRLSDKMMRLSSLCKDPNANPEVKDESIKDTIEDSINYLVYLYIVYQEERSDANDKERGT